jgi:hypothetical protein
MESGGRNSNIKGGFGNAIAREFSYVPFGSEQMFSWHRVKRTSHPRLRAVNCFYAVAGPQQFPFPKLSPPASGLFSF